MPRIGFVRNGLLGTSPYYSSPVFRRFVPWRAGLNFQFVAAILIFVLRRNRCDNAHLRGFTLTQVLHRFCTGFAQVLHTRTASQVDCVVAAGSGVRSLGLPVCIVASELGFAVR